MKLCYLCQQDDDHPNAGVQALSPGRRPALRGGFAFPSTTMGDSLAPRWGTHSIWKALKIRVKNQGHGAFQVHKGRNEMIRLIAIAGFALVVATSAEAMSPAPLHQSEGMITQIRQARQVRQARQARQCEDPNQIVINGICMFWAEHVPPARHRCVEWNEGFCVEYYGTLKPCGPEVRC